MQIRFVINHFTITLSIGVAKGTQGPPNGNATMIKMSQKRLLLLEFL